MLMIVASHYVVHCGIIDRLRDDPMSATTLPMLIFGAWGKTGINCFVLITGWFMCRSQFSLRKILKLYAQIIFYTIIFYVIFCLSGYETFNPTKAIWKVFPIRMVSNEFISCFLVFYLLIPFANILIQNISKRQHLYLLFILLSIYTFLPLVPGYRFEFNYVSWFFVIYLIASYIRYYNFPVNISHRMWGWIALFSIITASAAFCSYFTLYKFGYIHSFMAYPWVTDSNAIWALIVSVTSFMYFKDLKLPYSSFINTVGATTFGVLLIHNNSDAMRLWLWQETIDGVGHVGSSLLWTMGYAIGCVLLIFIVCSAIDWLRGLILNPWLDRLFTRIECKLKQAQG